MYFTLFNEAWFLVNDENVYNDLNDETFLNSTFSDNLHIRFIKSNNIFWDWYQEHCVLMTKLCLFRKINAYLILTDENDYFIYYDLTSR